MNALFSSPIRSCDPAVFPEVCRGCEAELELVVSAEEGAYCRGCALLLTCHVIETVGFAYEEARAS